MNKKIFLTIMRTIRLPLWVKTVKIVYYDFSSTAIKFRALKESNYKKIWTLKFRT